MKFMRKYDKKRRSLVRILHGPLHIRALSSDPLIPEHTLRTVLTDHG